MARFKKSSIKLSFLTFAVLGVALLAGWMQHQANKHAQRMAEREIRCAKEIANPAAYLPFKQSADCVGWRPRSDAPRPAEA